jgi:hypothetical protein
MPDHLHLFASPGLLTRSFDRWITLWKARFTIGFSKQGFGWQQSAFHHRIRTYEDCEAKWKYIQQNAVRAGLVTDVGCTLAILYTLALLFGVCLPNFRAFSPKHCSGDQSLVGQRP